ncbi:MAG: transposase [Thermoplasmata archaeon]|nr:transposase [Thermoplasmata archaeon]
MPSGDRNGISAQGIFRDTWDYESKYDAANHLLSWLLTAEYSEIGALRDIIKLVNNHFNEILNWFDSGMSNGVMEGINSVIQGVKSRARGYRD